MTDMSFAEIREQLEKISHGRLDTRKLTGAAKVLQAAARAARNTRFKALPVACRQAAGEPEFYESCIIIERVSFTELEPGYTIACRVYLRSASGCRASGLGVAVRGRKDPFVPHVGGALALRRAMEGAFIVLGQREGTMPGPSPFAQHDWVPADALKIEDFKQLEGTEILCHCD